jgi:hypothetical protein
MDAEIRRRLRAGGEALNLESVGLSAALREGRLEPYRLQLAALLGHPAAQLVATPLPFSLPEQPVDYWDHVMERLDRWIPAASARAWLAVVYALLEQGLTDIDTVRKWREAEVELERIPLIAEAWVLDWTTDAHSQVREWLDEAASLTHMQNPLTLRLGDALLRRDDGSEVAGEPHEYSALSGILAGNQGTSQDSEGALAIVSRRLSADLIPCLLGFGDPLREYRAKRLEKGRTGLVLDVPALPKPWPRPKRPWT